MIRWPASVFGMLLFSCLPVHADPSDALRVRALLAKRTATIVIVHAVLEVEATSNGQTHKQEGLAAVTGAFVDPTGLVMMASLHASPGSGASQMHMTPSNYTVMIPPSQVEHPATLIASDPLLNIEFLKVTDLGATTVPFVDFSTAIEPLVGQQVFELSRMSRGFDYAPYVGIGIINGEIKKPRHAFLSVGGTTQPALPIYTEDGDLLGITAPVAANDHESAPGFLMTNHAYGETNSDTNGGVFLVSGKDVAGAIAQAVAHSASPSTSPPAPTPPTPTPPTPPAPTPPTPAPAAK